MRAFLVSILIAVCGCEGVETKQEDAGVMPPMPDADAAVVDPPIDAPPPPPGRELAPAAGRLTGGTWTVDIQLGSVVSQSTISGGSWSVRGGTPIQP